MARILIFGRDRGEARGLARLLRRDGHRTDIAGSHAVTLRMLLGRRPDLLVLAVPDPAMALRSFGRSVGQRIRRTPAIAVLPEGDPGWMDAEFPGLLDTLPTPFSEESFRARVDALLRVRKVLFTGAEENGADPAPPARPSGPARLLRWLFRREDRGADRPGREGRLLEPYLETAASIVGTVEERDAFDPGHGERVAAHCAAIGEEMGLEEDEIDLLLQAAPVHDIGKIALSAELLRKPTFSEGDFRLMKTHPRRGADLVRALTPFDGAARLVLTHHERPDGRGYYALSAGEVSPLSAVLTVADAFDGMTTARRGGEALPPSRALERMRADSGAAYDADCVEALAAAARPRRASIALPGEPETTAPRGRSAGPAKRPYR